MVDTVRLRYHLYRVTTSWGLYLPVSIVYLLDSGFGLGFVALTQAVFSFALLLAEVPTGYLGDRLGRRLTLGLGSAVRATGLLGYVVADSAPAFLACQGLFAVGWALGSGTVGAWGYELLAARGEADDYARLAGRGRAAELGVSAVLAVVGGSLYTVSAPAPFLANAVVAAAGIPVVLSAPAVRQEKEEETESFGLREGVRAVRALLGRPELRWVVVFVTLTFAVFDLSRTFEQPALRAAGVSDGQLGLVFGVLKLVTAGTASLAGRLEDRLGARTGLGLLVPVLGLGYAALFVTPLAVLPVVFLYRTTRSVVKPLRNQYLNDHLADQGRATALSGVSMLGAVTAGGLRLAAGPVGAATGPVLVLGIVAVGLSALAGLVWVLTAPFTRCETCAPAGPLTLGGSRS